MPDEIRGDAGARLATSAGMWLGFLLLVAVALYVQRSEAPPPDPPAAQDDSPALPGSVTGADHRRVTDEGPAGDQGSSGDEESAPDDTATAGATTIKNVTIRDRDGRVEFRGTVDLAPTLARIDRGDRLRFAHDGSKFSNREGLLPRKPGGYYHEFVHPTPGISGPGAQRVIVGREGEVYYTFDHYRSFRRIR